MGAVVSLPGLLAERRRRVLVESRLMGVAGGRLFDESALGGTLAVRSRDFR